MSNIGNCNKTPQYVLQKQSVMFKILLKSKVYKQFNKNNNNNKF